MPYILKNRRKNLKPSVASIYTHPGELNYTLTEVCLKYLKDAGESYRTYNDIIGALECCKQELYRRKIIKYENIKILSNCDVY